LYTEGWSVDSIYLALAFCLKLPCMLDFPSFPYTTPYERPPLGRAVSFLGGGCFPGGHCRARLSASPEVAALRVATHFNFVMNLNFKWFRFSWNWLIFDHRTNHQWSLHFTTLGDQDDGILKMARHRLSFYSSLKCVIFIVKLIRYFYATAPPHCIPYGKPISQPAGSHPHNDLTLLIYNKLLFFKYLVSLLSLFWFPSFWFPSARCHKDRRDFWVSAPWVFLTLNLLFLI
jgi:hypothetical protein